MDGFSVRVSTPPTSENPLQPVASADINPDVVDLGWGTSLAGGWQGCNIGMQPGAARTLAGPMQSTMDVDGFLHLEVTRGLTTVFEGRIVEAADTPDGTDGIIAEGYGISAVHDNWITAMSGSADTTGPMLATLIADYSPTIIQGDPEHWQDPQISYGTGAAAFYKRTLGEALEEILGIGSESGDAVAFMVWEGRKAWLQILTTPETPTFHLPWRGGIRRRRNWRECYGNITAEYGTASLGSVISDNTNFQSRFIDRYGLNRSKMLWIGNTPATVATALAAREAKRRYNPEVIYEFSVGDEGLPRHSGQPAQWWELRAGQSVRIGEDAETYWILETATDATQRRTTVTIGTPGMDWTSNAIRRWVEQGNRQRRGLAPNGIGRMR